MGRSREMPFQLTLSRPKSHRLLSLQDQTIHDLIAQLTIKIPEFGVSIFYHLSFSL